jgi:hypothetical protein
VGVVRARAVVDDAGPQAPAAVDHGTGHVHAAVALKRADQAAVVRIGVALGRDAPERNDRERRLGDELQVVGRPYEVGDEPGQLEVVLDRLPERVGAVRPQRQPQLQRPEGPRVLERPLDRVLSELDLGDVGRVV